MRYVVACIFVCILLNGCIFSKQNLQPMEIVVTGEESQLPLANVRVEVFYSSLTVNTPDSVSGVTDANGVVRLPVAALENGSITVRVGGSTLPEFRQFHVTPDQVRTGGMPVGLLGDLPIQIEMKPIGGA